MTKNLVIVESPAKAKTIEKFLGKDFVVKSSFGHIRDLPKKGMSIDIENGFTPTYEVTEDKKKVIAELKRAVKTATTVWLAADEDREGEAIAWHLSEALKLKPENTRRIVFHEITKPAITKAVENPRELDMNLVNAQQARRVLDRLVGYELSPVLWKKVKGGLSAGRVQSVAVRLIVERERAILAFESESTFKIKVEFDLGDEKILVAELPKKLQTIKDAEKFLEKLKGADFAVADLQTKPSTRKPVAPFTTSTLQQEASRKLGFSVKQTMSVAQRLYESGKITYMRTDSVNLSEIAIEQAAKMIEADYGKEYVETRRYKTKDGSAQEAHEAIRPTDLTRKEVDGERNEQRLYDLIWKRAVASQMADAQIERTTATISVSTMKETLTAKGEMIKFDGFLNLYIEGADEEGEDDSKMLPVMTVGQSLTMQKALGQESFSRPPARFTEAALVKELEEKGIGRPSTYAPTISTVQDRGYVEKSALEGRERVVRSLVLEKESITPEERTETTGADKNKLVPTDLGMVVTDFLVKNFSSVVDFDFTVKVEQSFDQIADGKEQWNTMIGDFYVPFRKTIEEAGGIDKSEAVQARDLGVHPKSGKPIIVRMGRFGPMIQVGTKDDEDKPTFASVPKGKRMDEVTLEDAMAMLQLPRTVGKTPEGIEIKANAGRFGPYLQKEKLYVSISDEELMTISIEEALVKIAEKEQAEKEKYIQTWEGEDIQVLKGRYGPYIKAGKKNVKIPKDKDPAKLTLEECKALAEAFTPKGRGAKKAPVKKAAAKK